MCRVLSWSRYDLEFWPQGQIYRVFDMFLFPAHNYFWIDIGLPYLAHGFITMRICVKYIHDPDTTLTIDLKVKFIGIMTWLCVQTSALLSLDIDIFCFARKCITMVRFVAYIHELCMTLTFDLNIKIIPGIWVWQDAFALWYRHTKFWHMGVSPWDNMLCTFLTLVWPWTLTYMWVAWVTLVSFTHIFFSCLNSQHLGWRPGLWPWPLIMWPENLKYTQ